MINFFRFFFFILWIVSDVSAINIVRELVLVGIYGCIRWSCCSMLISAINFLKCPGKLSRLQVYARLPVPEAGICRIVPQHRNSRSGFNFAAAAQTRLAKPHFYGAEHTIDQNTSDFSNSILMFIRKSNDFGTFQNFLRKLTRNAIFLEIIPVVH